MTIEAFANALQAHCLTCVSGFDDLVSMMHLPQLHLYQHQEMAIRRVLSDMGGRAILADEVGLGKTIEAGVILKEYLVRGMVKRALILVPASLLPQWREELESKLAVTVTVGSSAESWSEDVVLASLDTAKRPESASIIWAQAYDILIVDEAHRLKSHSTVNWQFVSRIRKRFLLLLTATPVQNELRELYNMVTLLKPGQLRTYLHFKREFMLDKRTPKNPGELKRLLRPVLVRHTRRDTGLKFPERSVRNVASSLSGKSGEVYRLALAFVRANYRWMKDMESEQGRKSNVLPLILLLREACSSTGAAIRTGKSMLEAVVKSQTQPGITVPYTETGLLEELISVDVGLSLEGKTKSLLHLLDEWGQEKVLVFTEFVETAQHLVSVLDYSGIESAAFTGGMSTQEKTAAINKFRSTARVMVSTEAGGEGHNLQFARNVVNFDLPWNPMRVEQRIGRVHRLGQPYDVRVANIYADGTVEAYVLYLLDKKIRMFEAIVGELDLILAGLGKRTFEGRLADIILSSKDGDDLAKMVEALGDQLDEARMDYERTKHMNSLILD